MRENVAAATDPPKPRGDEIRPLDAAQPKAFLAGARDERLEALYVLAVTAGLRIGELLGLRWDDVDLGHGTLRVQRTLSAAKSGPKLTTPKNGKGRNIKLTERAVDALKRHKVAQNAERLESGTQWQDVGLVFCTRVGGPLCPHHFRTQSFKPLLKRTGLPDIRFHDLRHTAAEPGAPPQTGTGASRAFERGHDPGPLQPRDARHERPDRHRYRGCTVLTGSAVLAVCRTPRHRPPRVERTATEHPS